MEPRESRLAKNEAVFRGVNERVVELTRQLDSVSVFDPHAELVDGLICECSDAGCLERVGPLTAREYEAVRSDARRFIIAPNHQALDVETVIERHERYWIVEKHEGVPADVARERDPRN
jgi:hypothetical protein